jgi:alcohol dehydrogenase (cytochrome c)
VGIPAGTGRATAELWARRGSGCPARTEPARPQHRDRSGQWGDLPFVFRAGTDMWITGTYDPELDLIYWSTSQAKPWARFQRGTDGDALFSNTTLALDPDTGAVVWWHQFTPGETQDLDDVFEHVLVDSGTRKSMFKMGKLGILWQLD